LCIPYVVAAVIRGRFEAEAPELSGNIFETDLIISILGIAGARF
jgi:hypothetical protein